MLSRYQHPLDIDGLGVFVCLLLLNQFGICCTNEEKQTCWIRSILRGDFSKHFVFFFWGGCFFSSDVYVVNEEVYDKKSDYDHYVVKEKWKVCISFRSEKTHGDENKKRKIPKISGVHALINWEAAVCVSVCDCPQVCATGRSVWILTFWIQMSPAMHMIHMSNWFIVVKKNVQNGDLLFTAPKITFHWTHYVLHWQWNNVVL